MNLSMAQALPAPVMTAINKPGADMPPALALRDSSDQISDKPEVGAADQVTQPVTTSEQTQGNYNQSRAEPEARREFRAEGPPEPSPRERQEAAAEGYAMAQEAYGIPAHPEIQIGA